jgi:uncharacterized RDD family membrane protein YckC
MERQGFGIRLGAFLIDIVALIILSVIISVITGHGFGVSYGYRSGAGSVGYSLLMSLVILAYWSTEIFKAASPGKMLLGLSIGSETGTAASQNQLVTRWACKNAGSLIGLAATLIGAVIPIFGFIIGLVAVLSGLAIFVGCFLTLGAQRQALHDMLAHTAVYQLAPAAVGPAVTMPPPAPPAV